MTNNIHNLLEESLTYKLRSLFINISKEYGHQYKEIVYHNAIDNKLKEGGIIYISKPKITIHNITNGECLGYYYPDFLIENKIIIEIKVQAQILDYHISQLIKYLQTTKYELGLLVNFGTPLVQIIRRIYTNDRKTFLCQLNTESHK